MYSKFRGN